MCASTNPPFAVASLALIALEERSSDVWMILGMTAILQPEGMTVAGFVSLLMPKCFGLGVYWKGKRRDGEEVLS